MGLAGVAIAVLRHSAWSLSSHTLSGTTFAVDVCSTNNCTRRARFFTYRPRRFRLIIDCSVGFCMSPDSSFVEYGTKMRCPHQHDAIMSGVFYLANFVLGQRPFSTQANSAQGNSTSEGWLPRGVGSRRVGAQRVGARRLGADPLPPQISPFFCSPRGIVVLVQGHGLLKVCVWASLNIF